MHHCPLPLFTTPHQTHSLDLLKFPHCVKEFSGVPEGSLWRIVLTGAGQHHSPLQSSAVAFCNKVVVYPLSNNPQGNTSQMTSLNSLPPSAGEPRPHGEMGYPHRGVGDRSSPGRKGKHRSQKLGRQPQVFTMVPTLFSVGNEFLIAFPPKSHTNHFLT